MPGIIIVSDSVFVLCDEIIVSQQCAAELLEPRAWQLDDLKGEGQLHDAPVQEMVMAEDIDYDRMPHKRAPYNLPRQEVDR